MDETRDVVVVGAGVAGLTAAAGCAARGLSTVLVESLGPGGQAANIQDGFDTYGLNPSGAELTAELLDEALAAGAALEFAEAVSLQATADGPLLLTTTAGQLPTRAVVVATGTTVSVDGLPGAEDYVGRGVSTCAGCDGPLFSGKQVAVLGGDNISQFETAHLAPLASHTTLICPEPSLGITAATSLLTKHPSVKVLLGRTVTRLLGDAGVVTGLLLDDGTEMSVDGVFVYGRYSPNSGWLAGTVKVNAAGYVPTDDLRTDVRGVFAVGDIRAEARRRVICAASDGIAVAQDVTDYLSDA